MARILVVEDEAVTRQFLTDVLAEEGHLALQASGFRQARDVLSTEQLDLIITDQKMPDGEGLDVLGFSQEVDPTLPVVFLTAYASVELAVMAMRQGAFDFISKPFTPEEVQLVVRRACERTEVVRENARLKEEIRRLDPAGKLVGDSEAMRSVREEIARVAPTQATVLITGETGTGKELVARAIHRESQRARKPFMAVNCAALPENLLESELFGHERGAFTGANQMRKGLFEAAHEGTLFLDEAGEMSLALQAKLLRVLTDHQVVRVGGTKPRLVDVRILVATHRDLSRRMKEGVFREDLYYRLAVVPVAVPPLRSRREDIPLLIEYLRDQVAGELKVPRRTVSEQAVKKLKAYDFPGNVRELRNLLERAYILARRTVIGPEDFPVASGESVREPTDSGPTDPIWACVQRLPDEVNLREYMEAFECVLIRRALTEADGVQAEAARKLGISRSDMTYKMKKYGLVIER